MEIKEWCGKHGTTPDGGEGGLRGNVHHLIAPIMGQLQWRAGEVLPVHTAEYLYDRLKLVLALVDKELK